MILEKVINGCGCTLIKGDAGIEVTSVCNDSRKVTPGSLFVAVRGYASDGHSYIATAVEKGAAVIVCEDMEAAEAQLAKAGDAAEGTALVKADSSRYALAIIAANFYDNPSHKLTLVGITGTNMLWPPSTITSAPRSRKVSFSPSPQATATTP